MLAEEAVIADRLRALYIPGEGLGVALHQPGIYQPVAATFLQPSDRLVENDIRTEGLAVTLLGGQVVAGVRHVRAGQVGHRAEVICAIKVGDWKIHDLRGFATSDFIGKSIRLIARTDAPAASICTVFCHAFTVLSMALGLIPRLNLFFCVKEGAAVF